MKVQIIVPLAICASIALLGMVKVRKSEQEKEEKRNRFLSTKLRVTNDVLREYQSDEVESQKQMDKFVIEQKTLEADVETLQTKVDAAKIQGDECQVNKKSAKGEAAKIEIQFTSVKADTDKEKASWKTEVDTLQQTLAVRSPACDFLKKDSTTGKKLCGIEETAEKPKKEEPKKEEPKKEEPEKEEPKKEEPKKEEPKKVEGPKAEEPKKEEPKKEEPKKEEPKKVEGPKAEEPKKEEPKKGEIKKT